MIDVTKISKWLLVTTLITYWLVQIGYGFGVLEHYFYKALYIMVFVLLCTSKHSGNFIVQMFQALAFFQICKEFMGQALVRLYNDYVLAALSVAVTVGRFIYNRKQNKKNG